MAEGPLFAGAALRRLRRREGLTQAAMAQRLSISASYLNLIERNQRPLSARVLMQVVDAFDYDPRNLREDEAIGGVDGLARRIADERFADLDIERDELADWLATAPQAASAFARLYDAGGVAGPEGGIDPLVESRREIERWRGHFADLDHAAEALADELRLSRTEPGPALAERLRERHQLAIRVLPQSVMPDALRRLDLHARQLQLSEMLPPASRNFQLATQIALIEQRDTIVQLIAGSRLEDAAARALFERHLTAYFAAAVLMPYGRFLRACEATGYDLPVLMARFGVSFEQLAHRLTTLQRVGQRGLPFFMLRLDRAGQVSKRFAGASGAAWIESDRTCPLWTAHRAFERPGEWLVESVTLPAAAVPKGHWLTISRVVAGPGGGEGHDGARFVAVLGIEARLATSLAAVRGVSLDENDAQTIGPGCARCFRPDCRQRSLPPGGSALSFERTARGVTPFRFAGAPPASG